MFHHASPWWLVLVQVSAKKTERGSGHCSLPVLREGLNLRTSNPETAVFYRRTPAHRLAAAPAKAKAKPTAKAKAQAKAKAKARP